MWRTSSLGLMQRDGSDLHAFYLFADHWMWCIVGYVVCVILLQPRAVNVDLQTDATLQVDISDALSERDKVKFTVHTKVRRRRLNLASDRDFKSRPPAKAVFMLE